MYYTVINISTHAQFKTIIHIHQTPHAILIADVECCRHLSASRPLRPNVTPSITPEVHNIAACRQRRTESGDLHTECCDDGSSSSRDIYARGQTDRQTDGLIAILGRQGVVLARQADSSSSDRPHPHRTIRIRIINCYC